MNHTLVTLQTSQGLGLRGNLHRLRREQAFHDTYGLEPVLRMPEILTHSASLRYESPIYSGKAVVANLTQVGPCCNWQGAKPSDF